MVSSPITRVIKKVMPAVVSIVISKKLEDVKKEMPKVIPGSAPGQTPPTIPDEMVDAHGMVRVGGGSGFVVQQNGVILTNKHVVSEPGGEYTVVLNDNRKFPAVVLARDPIEDVAILKINAEGLPAVALGDSSKIELGQEIVAIGNALGLFRNTVSSGIVSGLARSIRAAPDPAKPVQDMRGLIQIDAAINPGNSGGPLVNMKGQAIGINAAIVYGAQNLSFALPISAAERDLHDLKMHGRIRRPLLGLRYLIVDENLQSKMKLAADHGALVSSHGPQRDAIVPGSPADKAGIRDGDLIIACNDEALTEQKTIQDFLETAEVDDVLRLKIVRGTKTMEVEVKLAERK